MAYTDFSLTRDKAPCYTCEHSLGGCKARSSCRLWAEWEQRKAARYADLRRARALQVEQFGIGSYIYRKAMARRAIGR